MKEHRPDPTARLQVDHAIQKARERAYEVAKSLQPDEVVQIELHLIGPEAATHEPDLYEGPGVEVVEYQCRGERDGRKSGRVSEIAGVAACRYAAQRDVERLNTPLEGALELSARQMAAAKRLVLDVAELVASRAEVAGMLMKADTDSAGMLLISASLVGNGLHDINVAYQLNGGSNYPVQAEAPVPVRSRRGRAARGVR